MQAMVQEARKLFSAALLIERREDDQLHVGRVADTEARIFEQHAPDGRMLNALRARQRPRNLALRPPLREVGTQPLEAFDKTLEIRIAGVARTVGAEHRQ